MGNSQDTAQEAGIRVVLPRTGLVVSAKGGAFGRLSLCTTKKSRAS
jgi:NAD dependent epimerase/dehydratase family enzyme